MPSSGRIQLNRSAFNGKWNPFTFAQNLWLNIWPVLNVSFQVNNSVSLWQQQLIYKSAMSHIYTTLDLLRESAYVSSASPSRSPVHPGNPLCLSVSHPFSHMLAVLHSRRHMNSSKVFALSETFQLQAQRIF
jgi:hypothetical protein